jgi:hypothetical protein
MVVPVVAYMRSVHDGDEPIVNCDNGVSWPSNRDRVRVLLRYAFPRTNLVAFGMNSKDIRIPDWKAPPPPPASYQGRGLIPPPPEGAVLQTSHRPHHPSS